MLLIHVDSEGSYKHATAKARAEGIEFTLVHPRDGANVSAPMYWAGDESLTDAYTLAGVERFDCDLPAPEKSVDESSAKPKRKGAKAEPELPADA